MPKNASIKLKNDYILNVRIRNAISVEQVVTGCDSRGFHFPVESIVELQGVGGTKLVRELAEDISDSMLT